MKQSSIVTNKEKYQSYFDNTIPHMVKHHIEMICLGVITLGLAYPWILCKKYETKCKHTVVCGKRLKFVGDPQELINHWIMWWLLIILTCGLYGLVVKVRFERWTAANTIFEEIEE